MRKGSHVDSTATARAARARSVTHAVLGRELLYGTILSTIWPAYLAPGKPTNPSFPYVLCVESPAGLVTWRVTPDEMTLFEHLGRRDAPVVATDRTAVLLHLATELLVERG